MVVVVLVVVVVWLALVAVPRSAAGGAVVVWDGAIGGAIGDYSDRGGDIRTRTRTRQV